MSFYGLPVGWVAASLEDVVEILDSRRVPVNAAEREARHGSVPYYGATGQVGWIDNYLFNEELVLLGEDGAPFLDPLRPKAYVIRGKSWVNNHAHVLRAVMGVSSAYVGYQLNRTDYHQFVSGTTRLKLPQAPMRRIPLRVAPPAEQTRIVDAIETQLTRLDAAVAALERVQANLKRYRTSVLKAAVEGRLVPTEAELARREGRDYEPASVLLQRILAERRRRWEESELAGMKAKGKAPKDEKWKTKYAEPESPDTRALPGLPDGWCWATCDQLGDVSGGLTKNQTRDILPVRLPYLGVANVHAAELRLNDVATIGLRPEELARVLLRRGDLLVVEGNGSIDQIGRVALWDASIPECVHQNHIIKVRFFSNALGPWVLAWLLSPSGRSKARRREARLRIARGESR